MKNMNEIITKKNALEATIESLSSGMARVGQAGGKEGDIEIHVAGMHQADIDKLTTMVRLQVNEFVRDTKQEKEIELLKVNKVIDEVEKLLESKS